MEDYKDHILILDDDRDFAESTADLLESEGYKTIVVFSIKEAVKELKEKNIRFLLSDVKLGPNIDGSKMIKKFKEIRRPLYVILITAYADTKTAIEAIKNNAYDYLKKPCKREDLLVCLNKMFHLANTEEELEKYKRNLEKQIEKRTFELEKANALLEMILDKVPIGIWQLDESFNIVYFNKTFSDIMKQECCQLATERWKKPFLQEDLEGKKFEEYFENLKNKEEIPGVEGKIRTEEGVKWIYIEFAPIYKKGIFKGCVGILYDITNRKETLEELYKIRDF